ncbi:hypothetical protein WJX74_000044 [Apatococcus lobatus]
MAKRRRIQPSQAVECDSDSGELNHATSSPLSREALYTELHSEAIPHDTLVALQLLVNQFPPAAKACVAPFALRSQLYSLVNDRTCVDRQLDELRTGRQVKVLKLPASTDEYAYMFALDYCAMVQAAKQKHQAAKGLVPELKVFEWLTDRVAPAYTKTTIQHAELLQLLGTDTSRGICDAVTEAQVSLLLHAGLLMRDMQDADLYLFSMAGAGPVVKSLLKQRKEFVMGLRRKRYPEVFMRELEKRKPIASALVDQRFLIRDLIGTNTLTQQETTSGPLLRLTSKH